MKASVIIPTYGHRPDYLRNAQLSVQDQSLPADDYEILVVDNSPGDSAFSIVEEVNRNGGHVVRYIRTPVVGLHHARHTGAREATGEILVYIDDDVVVHREWLAALLQPFEDPQVACDGGKILPLWEAQPPEWYSQFNPQYLSLLDLGGETRKLRWPACVWGCNMAVRREVLHRLGGFNPDALGDRKLIWLRGDGECGLQEKIYDAGLCVVYVPGAWVHHRIPASRLTPEHFFWRFFIQGIQDSYMRVRRLARRPFLGGRLVLYAAYSALQAARYHTGSLVFTNRAVHLRARAWRWYGVAQHQLRTALSPRLRRHVLRDSYL